MPPLPYEQEPGTRYFPGARVFVATTPQHYTVANLAKGGVVKVFAREDGRLLLNDCGLIGELADGQVVTSQWVDPAYRCEADEQGCTVSGHLHAVPSHKLFTPFKQILFRGALVALGWNPAFSHALKGAIRKTLMLGRRPVPIQFRRSLRLEGGTLRLIDELRQTGGEEPATLRRLSVGDEFFVRYVPQSRYFQSQELDVQGYAVAPEQLAALNAGQRLVIEQQMAAAQERASVPHVAADDQPIQSAELPFGVYGIDYFIGRQSKPQLMYRLRRRTDEVAEALQHYSDGPLRTVVDVGTADGLMLNLLRQRMPAVTFLGFDLSLELLRATPANGILKSQSDALQMPIQSGSADAIIATAIIEHVPDARAMLRECARMLRSGGLLVITTPDPLMEQISSRIGLLKEAGHQETLNLAQLCERAETTGFQVVEAKKFMFSPVGFPAEKLIERGMRATGLDLVMANQLVVVRKR
jgi:2-polyprenyl-3-methyl-5-hydroxy-6-metoxy-1,4-benzoquinol methylase